VKSGAGETDKFLVNPVDELRILHPHFTLAIEELSVDKFEDFWGRKTEPTLLMEAVRVSVTYSGSR
jgi:hypothetical protein